MSVLKLKAKLIEKNISVVELAERLDIDRSTLYRKMSSIKCFTVEEAQKIKVVLELSVDEMNDIFFD